MRIIATIVFAIVAMLSTTTMSFAACRRVADVPTVQIDPASLKALSKMDVTRASLFEAFAAVAAIETSGCWGGATGNFDDQIVSVGALQWNYGQESLPDMLRLYKIRMGQEFENEIKRLMPEHGSIIFSRGCLQNKITDQCKSAILALEINKDLTPSLRQELDALFESDTMIQVQVDKFVAKVESVADDIKRVFNAPATPRKILWAIDSKVQMKRPFPSQDTIARLQKAWDSPGLDKRAKLLALVDWYNGLSNSIDQGGIKLDVRCNVMHWREKISGGVDDEQAAILNLSFLASRLVDGQGGYWQALTFERHARIALGVGSVGGSTVGIPAQSACHR